MSATSSAIAKTYYRRSSLPPPNRIQYSPLQSSYNTGYMPTLDDYQRNQKSFGSNIRRYQPKTTFYDSRGLSFISKTKYYNDIDRKVEQSGNILKKIEVKAKANKTFQDASDDKISRTELKPKYERNFSYHANDR